MSDKPKFVHRIKPNRSVEYPVTRKSDAKQTTGEEQQTPPRVRFSGAQHVPGGTAGCRIRIRVQAPKHGVEVGIADGADSLEGELTAAAEATLDALRRAAPLKDGKLSLREVAAFDAFGKPAVMVSVALEMGAQSRTLLGFSPLGDDPPRAAALATLSATNRFLSSVLG